MMPLIVLLALTACSASNPDQNEQMQKDIKAIQTLPELTFKDVKPILEKRCIVCHGCFDAPCQLKLSSMEGITRGANKQKVYNKKRYFWQQPSRLFIDAKTTDEWRDMEFFSVLNEDELQSPEENLQNSLLYKMLNMKQLKSGRLPESGNLPDDLDVSLEREQVCTTLDEFDQFAKDHPLWGMPYALPGLPDEDYKLLVQWLAQGAKASEVERPSTETLPQIARWEAFFNGEGNKQQLVSRYIYEHLVLGHIHFKGAPEREFFRLVRFSTKTGQEIASIRPYDDPEEDFYYHLRPYTAGIVDKDHIVYELSDERMRRYKELFLQANYEVTELPDYDWGESSNFFMRNLRKLVRLVITPPTPFEIFSDIPLESRYQFLLDDARFFINGFIKGPVCRGQSALSSIEDHFWVFFLKPENPPGHKQHGLDAEFLKKVEKHLHLPTELSDTNRLFSAWIKYWPQEQKYMRAKLEYYHPELKEESLIEKIGNFLLGDSQKQKPKSEEKLPDIGDALKNFVWNGKRDDNTKNRNAALTVFRHFDSASVHYGLLGDEPETAWMIDYPVFERLHYLLVAGFNPFGVRGHQAAARLYMDFLRLEGEDNFLYFLPKLDRQRLYKSWHEIERKTLPEQRQATKAWLNVDSVTGYETNSLSKFYNQPQSELYHRLKKHTGPEPSDYLTNLKNCEKEGCSESDRAMQRLAKEVKGEILQNFPEVSYVRVGGKDSIAYTLIHNKSYRTDTFANEIMGRSDEDMKADTLTVLKGLAGSYPNFFFDVRPEEVEAFVTACKKIKDRGDYERVVANFGIRRTNSRFWSVADWFQDMHARAQPVESGILDLSRYKDRDQIASD
jgi:hypothetical protein